MISFVIFNASSLREAVQYIGGMFGSGNVPFMSAECAYYLRSYGVLLLIAAIGSTPWVTQAASSFTKTDFGKKLLPIMRPVWLVALFAVCTAYLIDSSFNPFLYFRF
jgi:alginate O-acetyltransferase complex protein AlgI